MFNCVVAAEEGGANLYLDGFAVAERLRVENPEAFKFFSQTSLAYQCFDDGCHYVAEGPIFRVDPLGFVDQVHDVIVIFQHMVGTMIFNMIRRIAG